jgi:PAS domain S-box-containing protein
MRMAIRPHPLESHPVLLAWLLPAAALLLQWPLWPWLAPYVWFLFFPAVFFSARLGGLWSGLASTLISIGTVWYFFIPPVLAWMPKTPSAPHTAVLFLLMGSLFSLAQESLRRRLLESQTRLQTLIDHAPAAMAMFDRERRYLAVSRRWLEDYQLGGQDLLGRAQDPLSPELPGAWKAAHARGLAGEVVRREEDRLERADGSVQYLRWEVRPWRNTKDAVGGIVIFSEDITARRQTEEAVRASHAQLEAALNSMQDAVFISDLQGQFLEINDAFATFHRFKSKADCAMTFASYPEFLEVFLPGGEPAPVDRWAVPRALRGETASAAR